MIVGGDGESTGLAEAPLRHIETSQHTSPRAATAPDDATLIEALLRYAMPGRDDTGALVQACLARFGSFAGLLSAPTREIRTIAGLGAHALSAVRLVQDASLRVVRARLDGGDLLDGREAMIAYLAAVLSRESIEQFRVLFLTPEHRLIADEAQARGTVNHTPVYPREVARRALEHGAAAIVLVHNHPSGDPTPSEADIAMTRQIVSACSILDVRVADHIIMGNGRWTSFADTGLLPQAGSSTA